MDKLTYIVKTLSRTRRKDYENFVVNAVWQRLADNGLKPVTQQFVRRANGSHYLIDLYFPQVNIGVECDEGYHDSSEQAQRDATREMEIIDAIRQISDESYEALHVRIGGKSIEEVDAQIDAHVARIRQEAATRRAAGTFEEWDPSAKSSDSVDGMDVLRVSDDIGFERIADACNKVMGCHYGGMQRSHFKPMGFKERGIDLRVWFPKLSLDGATATSAHGGWVNTLSPDGRRIYERSEDGERWKDVAFPQWERVVFVQMRDPVTGEWLYRFVGQFRFAGVGANALGLPCNVYERVSDEWEILR